MGVIYYNDTHPLTKELLPLSAVPTDDNCTAVRYYFQAYTRACLYWDKDINTWNSDGCEVNCVFIFLHYFNPAYFCSIEFFFFFGSVFQAVFLCSFFIIPNKTIEDETNSYQTVCGCSHLTDFGGGGPFATAEPLDLGALKRFSLKSNPTVFSVVMALFGAYLILFVWARKKDIRDFEKVMLLLTFIGFLC